MTTHGFSNVLHSSAQIGSPLSRADGSDPLSLSFTGAILLAVLIGAAITLCSVVIL
jgi:hypothetical protein